MTDKQIGSEKNILFYNDALGNTQIEVLLENEDVWLTQNALAKLFDTTRNNITLHVGNIYREKELDENSISKDSLLVQTEGSRRVQRNLKIYNLDIIISIGFRINSKKAIKLHFYFI